MPTSMLFGVNNEGRVFGLSTNGTKWREFPFPGIEFKHLSGVPHFLWAIGSDRQVYLHVHGLDTAIRIKEEAFENQRWLPMDGFSSRLLPTDRYGFSSEDGLTERRKDKIRVPSMAWKWESDWKIETMLDNEPLDHDGWTYAVDFPATYCATKKWSSCVRRRKWVRYRKYIAMNSWCAIAPLHTDPTQEPFRDVSVGCQNMTGSAPGALQVWAVSIHGRVMWRKGVSSVCPEGTKWNEIPLPGGVEVKRIWAGNGDRVWAITSSGSVLVRTGISPIQPTGESWLEVDPPLGDKDVKLAQICVGSNAVWALGEDSSLWFRKGTLQNPLGNGWVHMVGFMAAISISPNDQDKQHQKGCERSVWCGEPKVHHNLGTFPIIMMGKVPAPETRVVGVGMQDRNLYIRVGMGEGELAGKRWKLIETPVQDSRASSISSLSHQTNASVDDFSVSGQDFETSRSAPTSLNVQPVWHRANHPSSLPATQGFIEEPALCNHSIKEETDTRRKLTAWSPVRSVGSVLGLEANPDTNPLSVEWEGQVFQERESVCEPDWKQVITIWSYVEAGSLEIDPNHLPNWFSDSGYSSGLELSPWRSKILQNLQHSNLSCKAGFEKIELAVEKTSSVKSSECRYCVSGSDIFEDCVLELEWISNQNGSVESGSLIILSIEKNVTKYQVSLSEIIWVGSCSEPGVPRLAVHTFTTQRHLILQFPSDTELDEWTAQLTSVICGLQNVEGNPGTSSVWVTTALGDVFVFDPATMQVQQYEDNLFGKDLTFKHKAVPWKNTLCNGFPPDSHLVILCSISEHCDRFFVNLEGDKDGYAIFHFNPRFDERLIVRNSKENNIWGDEERNGGFPLKTGTNITIHILCHTEGFKVWLDGEFFTTFEHRMKPELISHCKIEGNIHLQKVTYKSNKLVCSGGDAFWRQMGGHMALVETSASGVTWGISADNTPWLYTGGWGGTFLSGYEKSETGVHPMKDMYCLHVYENQRWNPLTGFTSKGLPTDRPMWSDSTGHSKRSKDNIRLLNMHWLWVSDWSVDFTTPGGVDTDGWQYATDFPASYHSRKTLTDYVRRRRWSRKCKLSIMGPWQEIGNSKIVSVSLQHSSAVDTVCVWAVGINGDSLFRRGVSASNPMGENWEQVACDQPLEYISCGYGNQVWAVSRKGVALWRFGITTSNPIGMLWEMVDSPKGACLKKVSVAKWSVWALDVQGKVFVRHEVSPVFPEGSHWETVEYTDKFEDISAGGDEIWAVTSKGMLCRRVGVSKAYPVGLFWDHIINANWRTVSCRGYITKN